MYIFMGHLICILPLSAFLYLAVEAPLMTLLRTLFKKSILKYLSRHVMLTCECFADNPSDREQVKLEKEK
jgi:peptidoglycan/LPS O-acetylase OafA/YrhL